MSHFSLVTIFVGKCLVVENCVQKFVHKDIRLEWVHRIHINNSTSHVIIYTNFLYT